MKTKLAIALTALLSTSAMAHGDNSHQQNSCNVNLEQSIKVTPAYVQVLDGEKSLFRINDGTDLYAQGKRVHLTDEQQALVEEYSGLVQELAPQVAQLVTEGLAKAKSAIGTIFIELFGNDTELQSKVENIVAKFEQKAAPMMNTVKGEYYLAKESIDNNGNDFSKEIELEVENLLKESGGHMLIQIGKLLTQGDGSMADFQAKMESFGDDMEARGNELEAKANAMCSQVKRLDELETRMQHAIPQISGYNLLTLDRT